MTEPLLYTKLGNIPERLTRYEHQWVDGESVLMFHERWFLTEDHLGCPAGELVKNSMHGYVKKGLVIGAEQAQM